MWLFKNKVKILEFNSALRQFCLKLIQLFWRRSKNCPIFADWQTVDKIMTDNIDIKKKLMGFKRMQWFASLKWASMLNININYHKLLKQSWIINHCINIFFKSPDCIWLSHRWKRLQNSLCRSACANIRFSANIELQLNDFNHV